MTEVVTIELGGGHVALVEAQDAHLVRDRKWRAARRATKRENWYAAAPGRAGEPATVYMHRLIMSAGRGDIVDHRNCDGLDNRRGANLRLTTHFGNAANAVRIPGATGFHGVWRKRLRFVARIEAGGRRYQLGGYATAEEAARAYDAAAAVHHGEFARLNFPAAAQRDHGA